MSACRCGSGSTRARAWPGTPGRDRPSSRATRSTRLAEEFASTVAGEATVLRTRCLSYGAGLTFWTIGELIRELLELPDLESREAVHARLLEFLPEDEHKATIVERVQQLLGLEST